MIKKYLKKITKTIGNNRLTRSLLCWILTLIIKIVYKTGKFKYHNIDNIQDFWDKEKPVIIACWHGRLMLIPFSWKGKKTISALISPHRDGLIISGIFKKTGINTISGSSFKNPVRAAVAIKNTLKSGGSVAITPDGPRGPRMRIGKSLIYFAKKSGVPIIPITFSASPNKIIKSWDRFMIVYPFAKGVYSYGKPFYVPKDCNNETMEKLRITLENEMVTLQNNADKMMQVNPILQD